MVSDNYVLFVFKVAVTCIRVNRCFLMPQSDRSLSGPDIHFLPLKADV